MTNEQLLIKYSEIERKIHPIVEFLEENKTKYKDLYKGIITLQSPIVFQPEIFFGELIPEMVRIMNLIKRMQKP